MGYSSPESASAGAAAVMVGRRSLALVVVVTAVMLALPLVRARPGEDAWDHPPTSHEDADSEEDSHEHECCKYPDCLQGIPNIHCPREVCEYCCSKQHLNVPRPDYCLPYREPSTIFYLVAQIALGAALVVAIAALMSVILRTCSKGSRRRQRRPQIRTSAGSMTSADIYFTERLQDCPPCYDEVRWEKPPSYCNLQVIEESSTDGPARQGPSVPPAGDAPNAREPASPPPYGGIYTITQRVLQLQSSPTSTEDDRGIVFVAASQTSPTEESEKNESADEAKKSTAAKTENAAAAAVAQ